MSGGVVLSGACPEATNPAQETYLSPMPLNAGYAQAETITSTTNRAGQRLVRSSQTVRVGAGDRHAFRDDDTRSLCDQATLVLEDGLWAAGAIGSVCSACKRLAEQESSPSE